MVTLNKPENILVDYEYDGTKVIDFEMVVADWGSAVIGEDGGQFFGGTPVYAGPQTYKCFDKDLFSFGRMAMELFADKAGTESKTIFDNTKNKTRKKISKLI